MYESAETKRKMSSYKSKGDMPLMTPSQNLYIYIFFFFCNIALDCVMFHDDQSSCCAPRRPGLHHSPSICSSKPPTHAAGQRCTYEAGK